MRYPVWFAWVLPACLLSVSGLVRQSLYSLVGHYMAPYAGSKFIKTKSPLSCGVNCLNRPNCEMFAYDDATGMCLLAVPSCSNSIESSDESHLKMDCYVQVGSTFFTFTNIIVFKERKGIRLPFRKGLITLFFL